MSQDQQFAVDIVKWLAALCGILVIPFTVIGTVAFWRTERGGAKTFSMLIERGSIVRISAVFAIIFSAFILGAANIMKADLVSSILSGIAGYVLGGAFKFESSSKRTTSDED